MMCDPLTRVIQQQAPPGTGKTFTAMRIAADILEQDPEAVIVCTAPLNVAVVKMVIEMEEALRTQGLQETRKAMLTALRTQLSSRRNNSPRRSQRKSQIRWRWRPNINRSNRRVRIRKTALTNSLAGPKATYS